MQTCATTLEISVAVSQKIWNQPTSGSINNTLVHIPEDTQSYYIDICSTMFIATLFVIARPGNNLDAPQPKIG